MKKITLNEAIGLLKAKGLYAGRSEEQGRLWETAVKRLSYNSQKVGENTLFFCKGAHFKEEYLRDAFDRGAVCYIAERPVTEGLPYILVTDIRKAMAEVSGEFYEHIWNKKLQMVGITGTKGKTTTSYFLKAILDAHCAEKGLTGTGLISGAYTFDGKETKKSPGITTPETFELHEHLAECAKNGLDYVVVEASAQGFKYRRTDGLRFRVGCFLNMGEDHVSEIEHSDMEDYFHSKLKIVAQSDRLCVNADMDAEYRDRVLEEAKRLGRSVLLFGRNIEFGGGVAGCDIEAAIDKVKLKVKYEGRTEEIKVNIGGFYNADNALAAIAIALTLGVSFENIKKGLADARVPGRMEIFTLPDKDVKVVVDYAHNEMSFEALFRSVNEAWPERKKLFLFGCMGVKDKSRRRAAGRVADREADKVIITEDNYASEPFENICADIMAHISPAKDVEVIKSRDEAAQRALEFASDGWAVVMAGYSIGNFMLRENGPVETICDGDSVKKYIALHSR